MSTPSKMAKFSARSAAKLGQSAGSAALYAFREKPRSGFGWRTSVSAVLIAARPTRSRIRGASGGGGGGLGSSSPIRQLVLLARTRGRRSRHLIAFIGGRLLISACSPKPKGSG